MGLVLHNHHCFRGRKAAEANTTRETNALKAHWENANKSSQRLLNMRLCLWGVPRCLLGSWSLLTNRFDVLPNCGYCKYVDALQDLFFPSVSHFGMLSKHSTPDSVKHYLSAFSCLPPDLQTLQKVEGVSVQNCFGFGLAQDL